MRTKKIFGRFFNLATDVAITATSTAVGSSIAVYGISRDPLNDPELSAIVGVTSGAVAGTLTSKALHGIKYHVVKSQLK